ncbi:MAG TPA: hypothetical protein VGI43_18805 [Mucilaginibacter sp.]|jgi:hypothetical protein
MSTKEIQVQEQSKRYQLEEDIAAIKSFYLKLKEETSQLPLGNLIKKLLRLILQFIL